jgi:hypothetical protein
MLAREEYIKKHMRSCENCKLQPRCVTCNIEIAKQTGKESYLCTGRCNPSLWNISNKEFIEKMISQIGE